jgi:ABC-2 type transport system permease protein
VKGSSREGKTKLKALDKLRAILKRDLLIAVRHRAGFAVMFVGLLTQLAAFYFLALAIGPGFRPGGIEYFPYLLVGTGLYTFFVMSTQAFLSTIQEAQQTGTMEVLMTTSTRPAELVILSAISAFAGNLVNLAVYVLAGVTIFRAAVEVSPGAVVAVLVPSLLIAMALGLAAAAMQISFQRGSAVLWLLGSGLWFLSGAMFPIEKLPRPLFVLAHWFPLYYAIEGMRSALLEGRGVRMIAPTLVPLMGFGLVLLPLALWGLSLSLRRARQNGTVSFY